MLLQDANMCLLLLLLPCMQKLAAEGGSPPEQQ
jgi:hypothetical protein